VRLDIAHATRDRRAAGELAAAGGLCEELAPIALIVPAQLVAERIALLRGRDPDRPPGLTKVTRTH
jgi:glucosamine--fructose-6-phosphate aminotransferase (isomerizing)